MKISRIRERGAFALSVSDGMTDRITTRITARITARRLPQRWIALSVGVLALTVAPEWAHAQQSSAPAVAKPTGTNSQGKKILGVNDYTRWRSIENALISGDGKWVTYGLRFTNVPTADGKPVLHLVNQSNGRTRDTSRIKLMYRPRVGVGAADVVVLPERHPTAAPSRQDSRQSFCQQHRPAFHRWLIRERLRHRADVEMLRPPPLRVVMNCANLQRAACRRGPTCSPHRSRRAQRTYCCVRVAEAAVVQAVVVVAHLGAVALAGLLPQRLPLEMPRAELTSCCTI